MLVNVGQTVSLWVGDVVAEVLPLLLQADQEGGTSWGTILLLALLFLLILVGVMWFMRSSESRGAMGQPESPADSGVDLSATTPSTMPPRTMPPEAFVEPQGSAASLSDPGMMAPEFSEPVAPMPDDLARLEGIGPRIASTLQ
ncbi:MAG: hypothetical protein ACRDIB_00280, partial [Ardenticatenaceae bacterium]